MEHFRYCEPLVAKHMIGLGVYPPPPGYFWLNGGHARHLLTDEEKKLKSEDKNGLGHEVKELGLPSPLFINARNKASIVDFKNSFLRVKKIHYLIPTRSKVLQYLPGDGSPLSADQLDFDVNQTVAYLVEMTAQLNSHTLIQLEESLKNSISSNRYTEGTVENKVYALGEIIFKLVEINIKLRFARAQAKEFADVLDTLSKYPQLLYIQTERGGNLAEWVKKARETHKENVALFNRIENGASAGAEAVLLEYDTNKIKGILEFYLDSRFGHQSP